MKNDVFKNHDSNLAQTIYPLALSFEPLRKGEHVLIENGKNFSLIKYEDAQVGDLNPLKVRHSRNVTFHCMNWLIRNENDPYTHEDLSKRIVECARFEVLGTHKLNFEYDDEFGIYMSSVDSSNDVYLRIAQKFGDGRIEHLAKDIKFSIGDDLVISRLSEMLRPAYFEENIVPFMNCESTKFEVPMWSPASKNITNVTKSLTSRLFSSIFKSNNNEYNSDPFKPTYLSFNISVGREWLSNIAKYLNHGDFIYVGSKEEVYLMGLAKSDRDNIATQGTYITSTKPLLFFSNNYLNSYNPHMLNSRFDVESPLGFNGKPFIFNAIGRSQDCKNTVFTAEPEIITGNLEQALEHFNTTDFREFSDVVDKYARTIRIPTPGVKPNGNVFYY